MGSGADATDAAPGPGAARAVPMWVRFLPALLVWPQWAWVMERHGAWGAAYSAYWSIAVAMVAGSMIAGSTPLGGGVVAFPVAVLVIGFDPMQGRDFTLLIQSVGMTAAAFLILVRCPGRIHPELVIGSILSGVFGMLIGLSVKHDGRDGLPPFWVNTIFTTYILGFAFVYLYQNVCVVGRDGPRDAPGAEAPARRRLAVVGDVDAWELVSLLVAGVVGGLVTSQLGSGSDTFAYICGAFAWNSFRDPTRRVSETSLTASSVVVMAALSVFGAVLRALSGGVPRDVLLCWGACSPVVVLGAPVGSLLLSPPRADALRCCFYALAVVQFVTFGVLKIGDGTPPEGGRRGAVWAGIAGFFALLAAAIAAHRLHSRAAVAPAVGEPAAAKAVADTPALPEAPRGPGAASPGARPAARDGGDAVHDDGDIAAAPEVAPPWAEIWIAG